MNVDFLSFPIIGKPFNPFRHLTSVLFTFFLFNSISITHAEPSPLYGFGSFDLGAGKISALPSSLENDRDGLQLNLQTFSSYYAQQLPIVSDFGLGWEWGKRESVEKNSSLTKTFARGFFLEAASRYILTSYPSHDKTTFQLGPIVHYSMNGNVGLGNGTFTEDQSKKAFLFGLEAIVDLPQKKEWKQRFGLKVLRDLNIENRTITQVLVTYQIGLPLLGYLFKDPKEEKLPIVTRYRPLKQFKLVLDGSNIEFDLAKATLRPDSLARLHAIGRFLSQNSDKWQKLILSGHTDERGSVTSNQILSENRAKSVMKALIQSGVSKQKLSTRGFSENRPLDRAHTESAWQKNRRVEFDFSGVSEIELLSEGLLNETSVRGTETFDSSNEF